MVRPPQASGNEDIDKLAAHPCNPVLVGRRFSRVLRTGSGKQDRIHRERRAVQPDAAEDNPGSDLTHRIYCPGDRDVQGSVAAVEPFRSFLLPDHGGVLRFPEVILQKTQEKFGL